jgi:hypothetical protein
MKKLLTLILLLVSFSSFSQSFKSADYIYVVPSGARGIITVTVDYGQKVEKLKDYLLKDNSGKAIEFESIAGVINYFSKEGFDFVEMHTSKEISSTITTNYYLFKKKI